MRGMNMRRARLYVILLISVFLLCSMGVQGKGGSLLRIDGPCGWTKQLEVPLGSIVYLVVLPGTEGDAVISDQYPDGSIHSKSCYLQGYDRLPVAAAIPGRHVFSYVIAGKKSNSVIIDVTMAQAAAEIQQTRIVVPQPVIQATAVQAPPVVVSSRIRPVSLSKGAFVNSVMLQYYPTGAHIMNDQNGIVIPKYSSQYYFGRDFSLGTIDGNYPGTPFILQYLSDP